LIDSLSVLSTERN